MFITFVVKRKEKLFGDDVKQITKIMLWVVTGILVVVVQVRGTLSVLDFCYVCSLFLVANDKSTLHHNDIQKRKLQNLLKISSNNIFSDTHNPERVIFKFSSKELIDDKKSALSKDLKFSVKPGLAEYS